MTHDKDIVLKGLKAKSNFINLRTKMKIIITAGVMFTLLSIGFCQVPTSQKLDPNMALKKAEPDGIAWFDPRDDPFDLHGFEWMEQDGVYRRLPVHPD